MSNKEGPIQLEEVDEVLEGGAGNEQEAKSGSREPGERIGV